MYNLECSFHDLSFGYLKHLFFPELDHVLYCLLITLKVSQLFLNT